MPKPNFTLLWKLGISFLLTVISGAIVNALGLLDSYSCTFLIWQMSCSWFYLLMASLAFLLLLGIVQILWNLIEKHFCKKQKYKKSKLNGIEHSVKPKNQEEVQKHSYPINLKFAFINESESEYAGVRVTNLGNEPIHCYAKLIGLTKITGENKELIDLDRFNPRACYLQWEKPKNRSYYTESTILSNDSPRIIHLVDYKAIFNFYGWQSRMFSGYENEGSFIIKIQLLKNENDNLEVVKTMQKVLHITPLRIIRPRMSRGSTIKGLYSLEWQ